MIGGISDFLAKDLKEVTWSASYERVLQLEVTAIIFAGMDRENNNRFFNLSCKTYI